MRLVCGFAAPLAAPLAAGAPIDFADTSFPDRLGWREIVVEGSGVTLAGGRWRAPDGDDVSARLTAYPTNLLTQALADTSVAIAVTPGGPTLAPLRHPGRDAAARGAARSRRPTRRRRPRRRRHRRRAGRGHRAPAVPATAGGGARRRERWRPAVDLPHGRPLAAGPAGLDPDRGRPGCRPRPDAGARQDADGRLPRRDARDAAPRGRARAVGDVLAHARDPRPGGADRRGRGVPAAGPRRPLGAGRGGHLDRGDRRLDAVRRGSAALARSRRRAHDRARARRRPRPRARAPRPRPRPRRTTTTTTPTDARRPASTATAASATATCRRPGPTISWRSLFVLGLAGGLIPSTSALLILLGSIAAGRPGVRVRPGRRLRARDGAGHGRHRARARPRPRPARSRRRRLDRSAG